MTMTDEPDSVDELISRYLDGEATAAEITRVETDPALTARAESMRAAITAVAAPVTLPELELDRIRAAAIAQSTTSEQVTDLATARARKLERRNRVMAAAAAFVFLAVGVVAVQSIGGDDDDDGGVATESTDAAADDSAGDDGSDSSDDSADFSTSADMADEGAAMADDGAAEAEMAPEADDDMAEEDTLDDAPADDAGDTDDAAADEPLPLARIDLLPDELPAVADADALVASILEAYDGSTVDAEATIGADQTELLAEVCPPAADTLTELLPAGLAGVEQASVLLDGLVTTVVVGSGVDGTTVILTHAPDDCGVVVTQAVVDGP